MRSRRGRNASYRDAQTADDQKKLEVGLGRRRGQGHSASDLGAPSDIQRSRAAQPEHLLSRAIPRPGIPPGLLGPWSTRSTARVRRCLQHKGLKRARLRHADVARPARRGSSKLAYRHDGTPCILYFCLSGTPVPRWTITTAGQRVPVPKRRVLAKDSLLGWDLLSHAFCFSTSQSLTIRHPNRLDPA